MIYGLFFKKCLTKQEIVRIIGDVYLIARRHNMKNLVIVESPSKSKTIEKYLGGDYHVVSSKGCLLYTSPG